MTPQEKYSLHLAYEPIFNINDNEKVNINTLLTIYSIGGIYNSTVMCLNAKPYLRSFDQLTKPITQKDYNNGKPFVPAEVLAKIIGDTWFNDEYNVNQFIYEFVNGYIKLGFYKSIEVMQFLLKLHFAIGFEPGEYIEVTDENNHY